MIMWMKKANNFQIASLASGTPCLDLRIFCQFQLGVVYKSVALKKKRVNH